MPTTEQKQDVHAWWTVLYKDGTDLEEYPADGKYTPYRKIDWSKVKTLILESNYAKTEVPIGIPRQGYKLSLRSRHVKIISHGTAAMAYILLESKINEAVRDTTRSAFYWLPDGSIHSCDVFNCPKIKEYIIALVNGQDVTLASTHDDTK